MQLSLSKFPLILEYIDKQILQIVFVKVYRYSDFIKEKSQWSMKVLILGSSFCERKDCEIYIFMKNNFVMKDQILLTKFKSSIFINFFF